MERSSEIGGLGVKMKITSDNWVNMWGRAMFGMLISLPLAVISVNLAVFWLLFCGVYAVYCAQKGHKESMKKIIDEVVT